MNKIKQETDVTINIPAPDKGTTCIKIEGNKEGVKTAKAVSLDIFIIHWFIQKMMTIKEYLLIEAVNETKTQTTNLSLI